MHSGLTQHHKRKDIAIDFSSNILGQDIVDDRIALLWLEKDLRVDLIKLEIYILGLGQK